MRVVDVNGQWRLCNCAMIVIVIESVMNDSIVKQRRTIPGLMADGL